MLKVVEIKFTEGMNRAIALVSTTETEPNKAYEELRGHEARNLAIVEAAKQGMADPRINDSVSVIAVDAEGKQLTNPTVQKQAGFQASIPLIRKMV